MTINKDPLVFLDTRVSITKVLSELIETVPDRSADTDAGHYHSGSFLLVFCHRIGLVLG